MRRFTRLLAAFSATATVLAAAHVVRAQNDPPGTEAVAAPRPDRTAGVPAAALPARDVRKMVVENPLKAVVARTLVNAAAAESAPLSGANPGESATAAGAGSAAPPATRDDNPAVAPGHVRWRDDFDAARTAARRSRKPVLLFQLIGRLDQRFT